MRTGIISGVLLVLVGIVAGILYWRLQKVEKEKTQLVEEKVSLEENLRELDKRVMDMQKELERKDVELEEKNRRLEELQKEVQQAQALIRKYQEQGKISAKQAEEMRYKTEQMAYYLQKYQERIKELEEENQKLRQRTEELEKAVEQKETQARQIKEEKEKLAIKVKAASFLKAIEFRFAMVKDNGKEEWDREFRARRLHTLKICFQVLENEVAEPGERTVYLVISDPTNKIITNFSKGSGYFTLMDTEQPFSTKAVFQYNRQRQEVCALFERSDEELNKGTYTVVAFCEGVEIGRGQFQLK